MSHGFQESKRYSDCLTSNPVRNLHGRIRTHPERQLRASSQAEAPGTLVNRQNKKNFFSANQAGGGCELNLLPPCL